MLFCSKCGVCIFVWSVAGVWLEEEPEGCFWGSHRAIWEAMGDDFQRLIAQPATTHQVVRSLPRIIARETTCCCRKIIVQLVDGGFLMLGLSLSGHSWPVEGGRLNRCAIENHYPHRERWSCSISMENVVNWLERLTRFCSLFLKLGSCDPMGAEAVLFW